MGQSSACCNPTSHLNQIDCISLPNDALLLQPPTDPPAELVEPSEEVLRTIAKGEEYIRRQFQRQLIVDQHQLTYLEVVGKQGQSKQILHCRGAAKGTSLTGTVILYFPNKEIFKGVIEANRPSFGIFVFRHGCYYAGEMKGFNAEGTGRFQNIDSGYIYQGSWLKSFPHQIGKEQYSNGDTFEGEQIFGVKFNNGTYHFHNGNVYSGSFYYNKSDGHGKLTYANGDYYEGEWKLGLFNGHGKFVWANGERFQGQYVEGKRQGLGKYFFKNGSVYEGHWVNGLQQGEGVLRDKFDEIKGVWEQGELVNS